jgi:hypothetical protein
LTAYSTYEEPEVARYILKAVVAIDLPISLFDLSDVLSGSRIALTASV